MLVNSASTIEVTDQEYNAYVLAADIAAELFRGRYMAINPTILSDWTEYGYAVQLIAQIIVNADPRLLANLPVQAVS